MGVSKLFVMAVLVGAVAVIGCTDDDGGGGSGGTAGTGGTGGMPAEGCADADLVCADCEVDTPEWERCLGAVFFCNEIREPSECPDCIESSQPARDCDGAGGTGGTAGGGGTGGTPAEGCADADLVCANCEVDTPEWERCLGAVFICNEIVETNQCPGCVDVLQPGSDCDGTGGTGGTGGTAGTGGTGGTGGTAGTGGTGGTGGTAGTGGAGGGGGFPGSEVVCVFCLNEVAEQACEDRWNECITNPPSGNALEKCFVVAIAACLEIELGPF